MNEESLEMAALVDRGRRGVLVAPPPKSSKALALVALADVLEEARRPLPRGMVLVALVEEALTAVRQIQELVRPRRKTTKETA